MDVLDKETLLNDRDLNQALESHGPDKPVLFQIHHGLCWIPWERWPCVFENLKALADAHPSLKIQLSVIANGLGSNNPSNWVFYDEDDGQWCVAGKPQKLTEMTENAGCVASCDPYTLQEVEAEGEFAVHGLTFSFAQPQSPQKAEVQDDKEAVEIQQSS